MREMSPCCALTQCPFRAQEQQPNPPCCWFAWEKSLLRVRNWRVVGKAHLVSSRTEGEMPQTQFLLLNTGIKHIHTTYILNEGWGRHTAYTSLYPKRCLTCSFLARGAFIYLLQSRLKLWQHGRCKSPVTQWGKYKSTKIPKFTPAQPYNLEGVFHSLLCKTANKNAKRNIPNTITLQEIPIQLPMLPQPGVRSWCPITSENSSSFLKLLLAGLSSHTNHERKIQPLLQPEKIQVHVILSSGCPKHRAADEARLRGRASSGVQPSQGHCSKGGCSKSHQNTQQVPLVKAWAWKALKTAWMFS